MQESLHHRAAPGVAVFFARTSARTLLGCSQGVRRSSGEHSTNLGVTDLCGAPEHTPFRRGVGGFQSPARTKAVRLNCSSVATNGARPTPGKKEETSRTSPLVRPRRPG